jgi:hypothetical protein
LPSQKLLAIVFQNDRATLAGASHRRPGTGTSGLKAGGDSEMAPQAIEIAQNGLGDPSARSLGRRIDQGEFRLSFLPRGAAGSEVRIDCSICLSISRAATSEAVSP